MLFYTLVYFALFVSVFKVRYLDKLFYLTRFIPFHFFEVTCLNFLFKRANKT